MSWLSCSRKTSIARPAANANRAPASKSVRPLLVKGAAATALAISVVAGSEALRTEAYIPIKGDVPTICYGATKGVKLGDTATKEECDARLIRELGEFELGMRKCLVEPDRWSDKTYVAMLSATYNIGYGQRGFCGSSMARLMNAGDGPAACDALLRWNKAGGRVVKGLVNRRNDERKLCLEGMREAA